MKLFDILAVAALTGAVGGCGGGSVSSGAPPTTAFTSWSAVKPNTAVKADGMSQSVRTNYTVLPGGDLKVGPILAVSPVDTGDSSMTWTFDSNRNLAGIQVETPLGFVIWSNQLLGGGSASCSGTLCFGTEASGIASFVGYNPYDPAVAWNYQSFGVWAAGGGGSGTLGAMSFGAPTPTSRLPTVGAATYSGFSKGYYADPSGRVFNMDATMTANVNFGTRNVGFATTGTRLSDSSGALTLTPDLNLQGTLTYSAGTNRFDGAVTTTNLTGTATGRFYGPAAEEIGGTYALRNGLQESIIGGFGGKK